MALWLHGYAHGLAHGLDMSLRGQSSMVILIILKDFGHRCSSMNACLYLCTWHCLVEHLIAVLAFDLPRQTLL